MRPGDDHGALEELAEHPLGWLRLGCGLGLLVFIPFWGITLAWLRANVPHENATLWEWLQLAGLASLPVLAGGLGIALVVALFRWATGRVARWRNRRARQRYAELLAEDTPADSGARDAERP